MMTPEQKARRQIERQLKLGGWIKFRSRAFRTSNSLWPTSARDCSPSSTWYPIGGGEVPPIDEVPGNDRDDE